MTTGRPSGYASMTKSVVPFEFPRFCSELATGFPGLMMSTSIMPDRWLRVTVEPILTPYCTPAEYRPSGRENNRCCCDRV